MNILMIVGSLRRDSYNRQLAEHIERLIGGCAEVSTRRFDDIPLLNQDIEFPAPTPVERYRRAVAGADGIWIVTPEYNHSFPGGLKNLLDWLSRPILPDVKETVLQGKPVTISGAAGKSSASDARSALAVLAAWMRMDVIGGTGTGVCIDFANNALSIDDKTEVSLLNQVEAFLGRCSV